MSGSHHATALHQLAVPGHSLVHRLAPQAKLVGLVTFVVTVAVTPRHAVAVFGIDAAVLAGLRERAGRHGRSMQQELLQILAVAAAEQDSPRAVEPIELRTVSVGGTSSWTREEIYDDAGG